MVTGLIQEKLALLRKETKIDEEYDADGVYNWEHPRRIDTETDGRRCEISDGNDDGNTPRKVEGGIVVLRRPPALFQRPPRQRR